MTSQEMFKQVERLEREAKAAMDDKTKEMPLKSILAFAVQIEVCRAAAKMLERREQEMTVTE